MVFLTAICLECHFPHISPSVCTEAADLVFILDTSGSVKEEWTRSLRFARNLVDLLPVGKNNVRVGAVAYSNYAYRQFSLNTDYTRDGIKRLIDRYVRVSICEL